ncbi:hypothetical protein LshimejAT787_1901250 [Lyophyllum shimeji]|uniref:Uncharacterized protein n=1 Tax=Lyophyllum shimeji TaxID=47721 RepID=A0A9P3Q1F7_LYOSH|nr:hypothetical protein LshimejAT787_1901250 [Lyophyllum shimeji]
MARGDTGRDGTGLRKGTCAGCTNKDDDGAGNVKDVATIARKADEMLTVSRCLQLQSNWRRLAAGRSSVNKKSVRLLLGSLALVVCLPVEYFPRKCSAAAR